MATLHQKIKSQKPAKFMTRRKNRCQICGRPRSYMRKFSICRCCFRSMSLNGLIPGIRKASW